MPLHYIIIRLNFPFGENRPTPEWTRKRVQLLKRYTLPSLQNQSEQNFKVLLQCDPSTERKLLDNIPIVECFFTSLHQWREENVDGSKYILTTRLDSDDCIHRDFVKTLHEFVGSNRGQECLIDTEVFRYSLAFKKFRYMGQKGCSSMFLSVWSKSQFCYQTMHNQMAPLFENHKRMNIAGGLQILHDLNIVSASPEFRWRTRLRPSYWSKFAKEQLAFRRWKPTLESFGVDS